MLSTIVIHYQQCFNRLNCSKSSVLGEAPHKPILLLTIIELVETNQLTSKYIYLTPTLENTFEKIWCQYVHTQHRMNLAQPFYYMQTESFWYLCRSKLSDSNFFNKNKMKGLNALKRQVDYASIDEDLFLCLQNQTSREILRMFLMMRYFDSKGRLG